MIHLSPKKFVNPSYVEASIPLNSYGEQKTILDTFSWGLLLVEANHVTAPMQGLRLAASLALLMVTTAVLDDERAEVRESIILDLLRPLDDSLIYLSASARK